MKGELFAVILILSLYAGSSVKANSNKVDLAFATDVANYGVYENVDEDSNFEINFDSYFYNNNEEETVAYFTYTNLNEETENGYVLISLFDDLPYILEKGEGNPYHGERIYYINSQTSFEFLDGSYFFKENEITREEMDKAFENYYSFRENLNETDPSLLEETEESNQEIEKLIDEINNPLDVATLSIFDYVVYKDCNASSNESSVANYLKNKKSKTTVTYQTKCDTSYITPYIQGEYTYGSLNYYSGRSYRESAGVCGKISATTLIDFYNKRDCLGLGSGQDIYNELTKISDDISDDLIWIFNSINYLDDVFNCGSANNAHEVIILHELMMAKYFINHNLFYYAINIMSNIRVQVGFISTIKSFISRDYFMNRLCSEVFGLLYKWTNGTINLTNSSLAASNAPSLVTSKLESAQPVILGGLSSLSDINGGDDLLSNHYVTLVGRYKTKTQHKIWFIKYYTYHDYVELYDTNDKYDSKIIDWLVYRNTALFYVTSL